MYASYLFKSETYTNTHFHSYIEFIDSTGLNYIRFAHDKKQQNNTIMCEHNII